MTKRVIGRESAIFSRARLFRVRRLVELLQEASVAGKVLNATELGALFGVSPRTVYRDLDLLRDDEGAPIAYDDKRKGFYLERDDWSFRPAPLNAQEVFALSVARNLLRPFSGTPLEMGLESVFAKIGETIPSHLKVDAAALTDRFSVLTDDHVETDPKTWASIAGFIERQEAIAIRYRKFDGSVSRYLIHPYGLIAYHGNWYVLAGRPRRERPSTFAVSRIRSLRATGRRFRRPEGLNAEEHFRDAFGITSSGETVEVRLRVRKTIAAYVEERIWHPTQQITRRRNGDLELCFSTDGWKELVRWILSWQPDVEVLEPAQLRKRIAEKLAAGMRVNRER
jgi:predicted DNA-binding transcriptional regulator YafY